MELRIVIIVGCMVVLVGTLLQDFVDILKGGIGKNGSTCADTSVLSPGIPLVLVCYFSWSYVKHSEVVYNHWPSLAIFTLGLPVVKFYMAHCGCPHDPHTNASVRHLVARPLAPVDEQPFWKDDQRTSHDCCGFGLPIG